MVRASFKKKDSMCGPEARAGVSAGKTGRSNWSDCRQAGEAWNGRRTSAGAGAGACCCRWHEGQHAAAWLPGGRVSRRRTPALASIGRSLSTRYGVGPFSPAEKIGKWPTTTIQSAVEAFSVLSCGRKSQAGGQVGRWSQPPFSRSSRLVPAAARSARKRTPGGAAAGMAVGPRDILGRAAGRGPRASFKAEILCTYHPFPLRFVDRWRIRARIKVWLPRVPAWPEGSVPGLSRCPQHPVLNRAISRRRGQRSRICRVL